MCGRYVIEDYQELSERLSQVPFRYDFELPPNWNAAPTQTLPVVVEEDDAWVVKGMHWGLIPKWTKPGQRPKVMPINARSETVAEKPMFKPLISQRRCLVPANGFYEWQQRAGGGGKQPWFIHPKDHDLFLFAGLWDEANAGPDGEPIQSFTILTTDANADVSALHDRMPVALDDDVMPDWLDREETEVEPLVHLLSPAPDGSVEMHEVSRAVNSPQNNTPELVAPLDGEE
ncbi:MAG TPA: SOS response-associated peptidase [Thermomicrobiales bacterium]|nr:SOS response-associated peptidase [Thermomicrobiales bacterium]